MLIDDFSDQRNLLHDTLASDNYEIAGRVFNGSEAIDTFFKTQSDILLVKLYMSKKGPK